MKETSLVSLFQKGLFVKFTFLSLLVFGLVLARPATHFAQNLAHQVCLHSPSHQEGCAKV
jgi:hypothetical protein